MPTRTRVLEFIRQYRSEHPYGPTFREIADGVGILSDSTARYQCRILRQEGLIDYADSKARTIRVLEG